MTMQNENQGQFSATHWTMVLQAARQEGSTASLALEQLCQKYWRPLFVFARRRTGHRELAEDLTQGFLAFFIARNALAKVEPGKGKFRTFLLSCFTNYMNNEWDKEKALRRGGKIQFVSADALLEEERILASPDFVTATAEETVDLWWARTLVQTVFQRLKEDCIENGKTRAYDQLKPYLTRTPPAGTEDQLAEGLGTTAGNVRVILHRFRQRFGELLRKEVLDTVDSPEDVAGELQHLLALWMKFPADRTTRVS